MNLTKVVPDGVVLFFPSYSYESIVMNAWSKQPDGGRSVLELIEERKTVH